MNQLTLSISQLCSTGSEEKAIEVMNNMLSLMTTDIDLSGVSGEVIKLLALPYPPLKKIICTFLIRHATSILNLNILATNSLLHDFEDPNPYIRKLVINTCCSVPCLHELASQLLPRALRDPSAYVRGAAASSASLLISESNLDNNQDVVHALYGMIRDDDSSVTVSSLMALEEILKHEGGVAINSKIACYLMSRFSKFSEWELAVICTVLKKYAPKDSNEALSFLKMLECRLKHCDPIVFIPVIDLALHFVSEHHKDLVKDISQMMFNQMRLLLITSNSDNLIFLLEIIKKHVLKYEDLLLSHYKIFLCRYCDSAIVKIKKMDILPTLITKDSEKDIVDDILLHCSSGIPELSKHAVQSFVSVVQSHSSIHIFFKTFLQLLDIHHNKLNEKIIIALSSLDLNTLNEKSLVLKSVSQNIHNVTSIEGKKALLRIIASYAGEMKEAAYILQELVTDSDAFENEAFLMQLLHASMKLFLLRPAEIQIFLGNILKSMSSSDNVFKQKQALVYYHLLHNLKLANKMIKSNSC